MQIIEYGNKTAPSILYIPGLFMSGACFEAIASKLPKMHLVCVTLNGHDSSGEPYEGLNEEVHKLVSHLKARQMTEYQLVVGMSLGTIFAVELARQEELKIERIFLDGAVNFYQSKSRKAEAVAMNLIFGHFMKTSKQPEKIIRNLSKSFVGNWPQEMQRCMANMTQKSKKMIIQTLTEYQLPAGLKQPIYCLYGNKENNIRQNIDVIRKIYPKTEIQFVEGYGHLEYANRNPKEYAEKLMQILSDTI